MHELDNKEYKKKILLIMNNIHNYCEDNSINYYMIGGTLIGAVRHNGFIPWDDDIDIGMTREDYDKFCNLFNKNNKHSQYRLVTIYNDPNYYLPFAKVIDTNTYLVEKKSPKLNTIGAYVDVFPLDSLPNNKYKAKLFYYKTRFSRALWFSKHFSLSKNLSIIKNIILFMGKIILLPFSLHYILDKREKIISEYKYNTKSKNIAELAASAYGKNEIWKRKWFKDKTLLKFEASHFWAPKEYDKVLTKTFGDYMKLPPKEMQVSHHDFTVYGKG